VIRRDLFRLAGGVAAGLGCAPALLAATAPIGPGLVLYDERYSDARAFGAVARLDGARAVATGGDVAGLWYGGLEQDSAIGAIAGLTTYADMLVIAGLAAERRRRIVARIAHDARGAAVVAHHVERGAPAIEQRLAEAGAHWPGALWDAFAAAPGRGLKNRGGRGAPRAADNPGMLYSWMVG